jgi:hypothetical protein
METDTNILRTTLYRIKTVVEDLSTPHTHRDDMDVIKMWKLDIEQIYEGLKSRLYLISILK